MRGFEQELTGAEDFYAPTPLQCLVKTLLVCAEREGHTVCFGDCTDACLQSDLLEEIYVNPPVEAQEPADVVWRLHKALPGLKGALLHGVLASMVSWVALLWTFDALWLTRACGLTAPQESALDATWTISS